MLQPHGQQVLDIIGKYDADQPSTQGILLPEQMPQALHALDAAIVHDEKMRREAIEKAQAEHQPMPQFDPITLHHRALPFMDMVRQCIKDQLPITWGV